MNTASDANFSLRSYTWVNILALLILAASVAVFSYTRYYFVLAAPFALLFGAWLILNWKSFYWFYVLGIAFTAIVTVGSGIMYLPMMPLSLVAAGLALAVVLYNHKAVYSSFYRHPITLIMALQFFWLVVSVMFSEIHFLSFKYLGVNVIQLLSFVILPMLVLKEEKDWITLAKILLISFTLVGTFIFIRHATYQFGYLATNLVVYPFFFNHVDHGCLMSMLTPLPYIIWRQMDKGNKWRWFFLLLFAAFVLFTAMSLARAAMLAIIFSLVILYAIRKRMVNFLMACFFLVCIGLVTYLVQNDTYKRFRPNYEQTYSRATFDDLLKATFMGGDMSSMERIYRWIAAVRMSNERPLTGVGPNNFYYYYKPHAVQMFRTYVSRNEEKSTTHNYFLFMLVEQGWPAMILYGVFIWALFAWAQRLYHRAEQWMHKRMALLSAMVIAAFFVNNFFSELLQTYKIGAVFYMAVVLLFWLEMKVPKIKRLQQIVK